MKHVYQRRLYWKVLQNSLPKCVVTRLLTYTLCLGAGWEGLANALAHADIDGPWEGERCAELQDIEGHVRRGWHSDTCTPPIRWAVSSLRKRTAISVRAL